MTERAEKIAAMPTVPEKQGPPVHAYWIEASPNSLIPTIHGGSVKVGEEDWEFGMSWNGMNLVVSTELQVEERQHGGIDKRRFVLALGPLIQQLVKKLIGDEPMEPPITREQFEAVWGSMYAAMLRPEMYTGPAGDRTMQQRDKDAILAVLFPTAPVVDMDKKDG